jgi:isochorismate synthase
VIARTVRLDADVDLLAVAGPTGFLFEEHGAGLAGRGVAMRVALADAQAELAAIHTEDEVGLPGCGPVAFGALPFSAGKVTSGSGEVVIPELVVGRTADGTRWITTIGPIGAVTPPIECAAPAPRPGWAADIRITSSRPPSEWQHAIAAARDHIRAGTLDKVVLARELVVEATESIDVVGVLARLRSAFASSFVYSVDGLVGASPELLVSRTGDVVRSHPLAGTAPRSGDPAVDARLASSLVASTKDQLEHRLTIAMVHDTLLPWCSYLDEEAEPSIVAVANVQHLGTLVEGRLSKPLPSVLDLVGALHPTPAVGGFPRDTALEMIDELEDLDRGRYAGPVGWVDAVGNGRWAVALRCAQIDGSTARLYAGVGVVRDSDVDAELAETQAKFAAMLGALLRP